MRCTMTIMYSISIFENLCFRLSARTVKPGGVSPKGEEKYDLVSSQSRFWPKAFFAPKGSLTKISTDLRESRTASSLVLVFRGSIHL